MHTPVSYIDKEGRPKICLHKHQHLPEALFSEKTAGVRATDQLVSAKTLQKQKHPSSDKEGREEKDTEGKASMDRAKKGVNRPGSRDSPKGKTVLVELAWDIPMSMALPIQVKIDATHQPFPFLDTTPADPEIREWVCFSI